MYNNKLVLKRINLGFVIKIAVLAYIIILHILYLNYYENIFRTSYNGKLFIYSFDIAKYIFCIFQTAILYRLVLNKILRVELTEKIILVLYLLYFIPGVLQQAVTNSEWAHMIYYFLFWVAIEIWSRVIKPKKNNMLHKNIVIGNMRGYEGIIQIISIISVFSIFGIAIYAGRLPTINNISYSLIDTYAVRASATENEMHWIIRNIEYFAAYFMILSIGYYSEKRRWIMVILLFAGVFCAFVIQGNRLIIFLAGIALLCGLLNIDNKKIVLGVLAIAVVLFLEVLLTEKGAIFTDVFRRYSVVPNRLSEFYYDYFTQNEPDFLRLNYPRISSLLGIPQPYKDIDVSHLIGLNYLGIDLGANTGLVGGALFKFGYAGIVFSTFGYVMVFRLFEGVTFNISDSKFVTSLAILLSTIAINLPALLASLFGMTYILLLYLSMLLFGERKVKRNSR